MSDVEFEATSLDSALGVVDDEPQVETPEEPVEEQPQEETQEKTPAEEEPKEEQEDPLPEDKAKQFSELRDVVKDLRAQLKDKEVEPPSKVEIPDVLDDPEGFSQHVESKVDAKLITATANMSEKMAKMQFDDYDAVAERFYDEVEKNPAIAGLVHSSDHPALVVYEQGKKLLELDEIGNPAEFRAKIEAQVRAEILAEKTKAAKDSAANDTKLKDSLPDDLTNETNAGDRQGPKWSGPKPLDELIG